MANSPEGVSPLQKGKTNLKRFSIYSNFLIDIEPPILWKPIFAKAGGILALLCKSIPKDYSMSISFLGIKGTFS